jgi:dual specificity tyrosine-phosphorylation-regulated kinase 2/3/4
MIKKENKTGLKVIDFGSGCFDGEQIYNYVQSRYYRAP